MRKGEKKKKVEVEIYKSNRRRKVTKVTDSKPDHDLNDNTGHWENKHKMYKGQRRTGFRCKEMGH